MDENNQGAVAAGSPAGTAQVDGGQGTQGEGHQPQTPTYAGFKTPEELAADYERVKREAEELSGLKGRLGDQLGKERAEKARLEGILQGIQQSRVPAGPAVTLADLDAQLGRNDITLPEYLSKRDQLKTAEIRQAIKQEIGGFQSEFQREKYIEQFVRDNPGYTDAFNKGLLAEWIDRGYTGEEAWTQYQLRQTATERDTLKKQIEEQTNKARQEGIQAGTKIEAGKQAAGKVLGGDQGGGTSFAQGKTTTPLRTHTERVQAGVALLNRMRSGS